MRRCLMRKRWFKRTRVFHSRVRRGGPIHIELHEFRHESIAQFFAGDYATL